MAATRPDGVVLYYLATPLFGVADLAFHAPLRVAAVMPPEWRVAYYGGVFLAGVLCLVRPRATPWVGMLESSGNLLILLLGILLPVWNTALAVGGGAPLAPVLTGWSLGNAALAGSALTLSFHRHQAQALGGKVRRDR